MIETRKLEAFATSARTQLIAEVTARLNGILAATSTARIEAPAAIKALEDDIRHHGSDTQGRKHVAEQQAYVWFNRIIAFRFMDANGYTATPVVSPEGGRDTGQPAVLAAAKRGEYDPAVFANAKIAQRITGLLDNTITSHDPQGEAYGLILNAHCAFWNKAMPFMFAPEGNYTSLLMPGNLLAEDSVLSKAVVTLTADDCQDVEVIGWLYQYYISARKDEVFAGFAKGKKAGADEIPAATQLFTPDWIVRYLVQNSVGRLWMLNHPESRLVDQMEYYIDAGREERQLAGSTGAKENVDERSEEHIAPVGDPGEFLRINRPEELTVMDPACGSGHMLTYAFDLLYAIYEEEGYAPSEIPNLILAHNLFGCEIDGRAGALAAFALTMKARARQRTFFRNPSQPNICVLENIPGTEFAHADLFGSLIRPDETDLPSRSAASTVAESSQDALVGFTGDLFTESEAQLARQVGYLSRTYAVVVTNPPYMGSKNMDATLAAFAKESYPATKSDLFAMFIERCLALTTRRGQLGFMTPFVWMFIKTYEPLRQSLLKHKTITSLIQLEYSGFDGATVPICTFTLQNGSIPNYQGGYVRLADFVGPRLQAPKALEAVQDQTRNWFFRATTADFEAIPGTPIVYWLSEKMRAAFQRTVDSMPVVPFREGMSTSDNDRFVREWHEVSHRSTSFDSDSRVSASLAPTKWFPFDQGGGFRKWWGNQESVVNWAYDGAEIHSEGLKPRINNPDYFFKPHLTISKISSGAPSFRTFPCGFALASVSKCAFFDSAVSLREVCGLLNSNTMQEMLAAKSPTLSFLASDLEKLPLRNAHTGKQASSDMCIADLVETSRRDWDSFETSWHFGVNTVVAGFRAMAAE